MFIPWTPRLGLRKPVEPKPAPVAAAPKPKPAPVAAAPKPKPQLCTRTLHIARAIIASAVEPFPEVARAISAAFLAYIRDKLHVDVSGDPLTWTVTTADT